MLRIPLLLCCLAPLVPAQNLASYAAGTAGNPAVAPDPTTQGWTLDDPSGGVTTFAPISPDPGTGLNAWQIDDQGTANGQRGHYQVLFSPTEIQNASTLGWQLSMDMRPLFTSGINLFYEYASGPANTDDRYLLFFEISGMDVIAVDFLGGNQMHTCPGGADGNYHNYSLRKPAGQLDAELWYDGALIAILPPAGSNGNAPPGGVHWGSGSSGATMTANFNSVRFDLLGGLGTNYCGPAVANSTGSPGAVSAAGDSVAANNDVTLTAAELPLNQFGIFITSMSQGFIPNPGGSQGNLCLGGGIGRYNGPGQVLNSGTLGEFSLMINLQATPTPTGPTAISAGQTWHFQAWYRDLVGGSPTSNFTDGLSIAFQ